MPKTFTETRTIGPEETRHTFTFPLADGYVLGECGYPHRRPWEPNVAISIEADGRPCEPRHSTPAWFYTAKWRREVTFHATNLSGEEVAVAMRWEAYTQAEVDAMLSALGLWAPKAQRLIDRAGV